MIAILIILCVPINGKMGVAKNVKLIQELDMMRTTDVIVVKYRMVNGKKQKRRWNVTKQRWEDPEWTSM
jgi:hypothetical protein